MGAVRVEHRQIMILLRHGRHPPSTPLNTIPPILARLCRLYGIQTSYKDTQRQNQEATVESVLAILKGLGANVSKLADVDRALLERRQELAQRLIEPVAVAWEGRIPPIMLRTTEAVSGETLRYKLKLESGESQDLIVPLSRLAVRNTQDVGNIRYIERELTVGRPLPTGYHRLSLELKGQRHEMMLISAPMRAHFPFKRKEWGVFAPLYSLHSKRSPNAGDLTDFETLVDWMGVLGGRVAATLPLLASFMDKPFEPSPYLPASRLFWNEFYTDVGESRRASRSDLVDYRKEMEFRRSVLEKDAAALFKGGRNEARTRFDAFVKHDPELKAYAAFRAATEAQQAGWREWPKRMRDGDIRPGDYSASAERYHLYAQWRVQEQLKELSEKTRRTGQLLYLDLPLGLHQDSYDIWRHRELFVRDVSGGAPPDAVCAEGQNWNFPPMHPEVTRTHHHAYTIAYIRNHLRYARMLRIDHVMGLHRLFWIPNGFSGDKGVYVEYPAEELYAILSVESHRSQAGIVGENLGTVPPAVNLAMQRHNIQQMAVIQYEIRGDDPKRALRPLPADAVTSLNTHDMPPFRAFLDGKDIDDRGEGARKQHLERSRLRKLLVEFLKSKHLLPAGTRVSPEVVFEATLQFLGASQANVVLVNIEDLWQEILPQNVPGTQQERPNWRRRLKLTLEELEESKEAADSLRLVEKGRRLRRPEE